MAESFILCGHQAFKTHIENIAVFMHKDDCVEVVQGMDKGSDVDLTRLESGMSFLQVKASRTMKEKLRQVRNDICVNQREIAHTRLEAIAGADSPYSLITIFRRGHLAIKADGAVYVTRCAPLEVIPSEIRIAWKKYLHCPTGQKSSWTP
jgi:ribosomal protein L24